MPGPLSLPKESVLKLQGACADCDDMLEHMIKPGMENGLPLETAKAEILRARALAAGLLRTAGHTPPTPPGEGVA